MNTQSVKPVVRVDYHDGVAVAWMGPLDGEQLFLTPELGRELGSLLEQVERDGATAVVLTSSASDFLLGADVRQLEAAQSSDEAQWLSNQAQGLTDAIAHCRVPVVAAIHGGCLGGGLELALACWARVASDDPTTRLGQPEIQLGLIPGAGATQRLPRLVGVQLGLDLMLTGRTLSAADSKDVGLVDEVVPHAVLIEAACRRARGLAEREADGAPAEASRLRRVKHWLEPAELAEHALADNPLGRLFVFQRAGHSVQARTRGNYPASEQLLKVVRTGLSKGTEAGLRAEARAFGALSVSAEAKQLMRLFLLRQERKSRPSGLSRETQPRRLERAAVLGAGLMGSGIAYVTLEAGLRVRWKDADDEALGGGLRQLRRLLHKGVRHEKRSQLEAEELFHRVGPTTEYDGFRGAEIVIEAVSERLELKQKVLRETERVCSPETIFASNTSSLPIAKIAEASQRPENVIGMHYFSPVHKMPLLEVAVTEKTAPHVLATCLELGKRQGKSIIVVRDSPGFYTTRILAVYLNEAIRALTDGARVESIDDALRDFGFPLGPLELADEVGLTVADGVAHILHEAFGARMTPPTALRSLLADQRKGHKNRRGFYLYDDGARRGDPALYALLDVRASGPEPSHESIVERCVLMMVNEAVRCYGEGVLHDAQDGDLGAVLGLGFPPFLGGPFSYVDRRTPEELVRRLAALREQFGGRFSPAPQLLEMANAGERFFRGPARQPAPSAVFGNHQARA